MARVRTRRFAAVAVAAAAVAVLGGGPAGATDVDRGVCRRSPIRSATTTAGPRSTSRGLRAGTTSSGRARARRTPPSTGSTTIRSSRPRPTRRRAVRHDQGRRNVHRDQGQARRGLDLRVRSNGGGPVPDVRLRRPPGGFDRGNVHVSILFDTEGDNVPGGIFIEELASKRTDRIQASTTSAGSSRS